MMQAPEEDPEENTDVGSPVVTEDVAMIASPLGANLMKRKRAQAKKGVNDGSTFQLSDKAADGDVQACPVGASPEVSRMKRRKN